MGEYNKLTGTYTSVHHNKFHLPLHPHADFVTYMFSRSFADEETANRVALIDGESGMSLTRGLLRDSIERLASRLHHSLGIQQGEVVMILLPNSLHFPIIFNAVLKAGAVATAVNPDPLVTTPLDIHKQLVSSQAKLIFTNKAGKERLGSLSSSVPVLLIEDEQLLAKTSLGSNVNGSLKNSLRIRQSDPAVLLYSSGTTGLSKGVVTSHGNLIAAMAVTSSSPDEMDDPEDVILVNFPMCSMGGLVWLACAALLGGPKLVFLPKHNVSSLMAAVHRHRVTKLTCAPPAILELLNAEQSSSSDLSSLRTVICAGAPLSKDTMEAALLKFPHVTKFLQLYGMTETSSLGSGGAGPLGSVGACSWGMEARVVDLETGVPLSPNRRGELLLRGPSVMQGYLNNRVATADTIDPDGWLHTGDAGYFDENGYLYILERLKEYIKYKGSQVAPAELEAILLNHPDIVDCAVVPYPDKVAGEIPLACVVKSTGKELESENVMAFVASQVSALKSVRKVVFMDKIPKSATGKILRRELKVRFASTQV